MEKIINLLNISEAQQALFCAAAPGIEQVFPARESMRGMCGTVAAEEYASATVILGNAPPSLVRESSELRWLQTSSAGVDAYLVPGLLRENTMLTSAIGAFGQAVSEHMFALLWALLKRLPGYRDQQSDAVWNSLGQVKTLCGAVVLIAGAGDIGSAFGTLCKAVGAHTVGLRRDAQKPADGIDEMHTLSSLDALLPQADVVALFLPHSQETAGLMDERRLRLMKPDAVLLNGGRGSAVDVDALAEVLEQGHLWGAGLDVTAPEPLSAEHPLWRQERALITPHVAGFDHLPATKERVIDIALENLKRYVAGTPLHNRMR